MFGFFLNLAQENIYQFLLLSYGRQIRVKLACSLLLFHSQHKQVNVIHLGVWFNVLHLVGDVKNGTSPTLSAGCSLACDAATFKTGLFTPNERVCAPAPKRYYVFSEKYTLVPLDSIASPSRLRA